MYPAYLSSFLFFYRSIRLCCCSRSLGTGFSCFSLAVCGAKCAWAVPAAGVGGRRRRRALPALSYGKGECAYYTSSGNENSLHLLPHSLRSRGLDRKLPQRAKARVNCFPCWEGSSERNSQEVGLVIFFPVVPLFFVCGEAQTVELSKLLVLLLVLWWPFSILRYKNLYKIRFID